MNSRHASIALRATAAVLAVLLLQVAAGCSRSGSDADADSTSAVITLRYASPYSPGHPFSRADKAWMQHVEQQSGGRLRIQPFWGGSLLDESDSVRELAAGVADIAYIVPIYARAGMHFIRGQTPFYDGANDMRLQNKVFHTLWDTYPQMRAELKDVMPLLATGGSVQDIMTTKRPIRTLADLKGLRLRAPMEVTELLEKLGVDAEFMPMGEVYTALAKGTIDGVVAPQDTLKAMRFAEVVKYCTVVSLGRGAYYSRAMNHESWDRLPPDLQQVITASRTVWDEVSIAEIDAAADSGHQFAREQGVEFIELPSADLQQVRVLYSQMAQARAKDMQRFNLPGDEAYALAQQVIAQANRATNEGH
jgi:TRAP-type C4-dicarboxylate transport system substrate-binding protein